MGLHNQCSDIGSFCPAHIHNVIGIPLCNLRFPVRSPSQTSLVNETTCLIPWRIFEDGPCMTL